MQSQSLVNEQSKVKLLENEYDYFKKQAQVMRDQMSNEISELRK